VEICANSSAIIVSRYIEIKSSSAHYLFSLSLSVSLFLFKTYAYAQHGHWTICMFSRTCKLVKLDLVLEWINLLQDLYRQARPYMSAFFTIIFNFINKILHIILLIMHSLNTLCVTTTIRGACVYQMHTRTIIMVLILMHSLLKQWFFDSIILWNYRLAIMTVKAISLLLYRVIHNVTALWNMN